MGKFIFFGVFLKVFILEVVIYIFLLIIYFKWKGNRAGILLLIDCFFILLFDYDLRNVNGKNKVILLE